ncbi:hypothetical protein HGM15179_018788 [Zosterops borbonicus]|uniref:Uncharacterized protein n=1 Tax=Zosterops borbonicus TaxID=364589 RepID=A0A8K1DAH5_9PASS|nr:hypothetical protein HGM15179_018788 [Zosterops borbonicus]
MFSLLSTSTPTSLSTWTLSSHCPQPVALQGVVVAKVQDSALGLVKLHVDGLGPSIQPVQVPLQSPPSLLHIDTCSQLGVTCKFSNGGLSPLIHIINEDIKQDWPLHRCLGDTTSDWLPTGCSTVHHHLLTIEREMRKTDW